MNTSMMLRQQLQTSIDQDIAERTRIHQAAVARIRTGNATMKAMSLAGGLQPPVQPQPLIMLAHGDSWFDYPLSGNDITFGTTDVINHLGSMGVVNPVILNLSHHGDTSTDEMSLPKKTRMLKAMQDAANWGGSKKPDAILLSAGGNDIAGDQFCIFLDYAGQSASGLNLPRFAGALGMVEASFRDLFAFRDRHCPGTPVFAHCYDFPIPNGSHPVCSGPWLQPSLQYAGWTDVAKGTAIVKEALQQFRSQLLGLAADPANCFFLVDSQGLLAPSDWANELHPYPAGFKTVANAFVTTLRAHFAGRI